MPRVLAVEANHDPKKSVVQEDQMDARLLRMLEDEGISFKAVRLLETTHSERFGSEFRLLVESADKFRILVLGIHKY